jgi:succinate dehydrogenase (ubiquinone) iron-sulfur subunit
MMTQSRIFSTRAPGSDTNLSDVGELFKVNYTIEYD